MRTAIFLLLLAAALGYALWKGGGPEKSMAAILGAMLLSDQALHLFVPVHYAMVDQGHLVIDIFGAMTAIALALFAHRFWPMLAAVLQILPLIAHFCRAVDLAMHPAAYMVMQVAASWLLPPLLVLATLRHRRRLAATGSDRSWQSFSRRSNPSAQTL